MFDDHTDTKNNVRRGIRAWIVPSVIRTVLLGDRINYEQIRMAFRFEAFDLASINEYFAGRVKGYSDPAGEFLSSQLTSNFNDLINYPEILQLKETAGFVGILIWAHENKVYVSNASLSEALRVLKQQQANHGDKDLLQEKDFLVKNAKGQEVFQKYFVHRDPIGAERKLKFEDIKRPAPIFNQYGLSRLLWTDGNESTISYDENGRIVRLIGRQHDETTIQYDSRGRLMAIIDSKKNGVAIIWVDSVPILCRYVSIDPSSQKVVFHRQSQYTPVYDLGDVFDSLLAAWLQSQRLNRPTDAWLAAERHWHRELFYTLAVLLSLLLLLYRVRRPTGGGDGDITNGDPLTDSDDKRPIIRTAEPPVKSTDSNVAVALELLPKKRSETDEKAEAERNTEEARKLAEEGTKRAEAERIAREQAEEEAKRAEAERIACEQAEVLHDAIDKVQCDAIEPLIDALHESDWLKREAAAYSLGRLGVLAKPALEYLIDALIDITPRPGDVSGAIKCIHRAAAWAISQIGDVHAQLVEMLHHANSTVRLRAVVALECTSDLRASELLLEALRDENSNVRGEAARVLTRMGDPQAISLMIAQLSEMLHSEDREVRRSAVEALGPITDYRALEALLEALHDEDSGVRRSAESALNSMHKSQAIEPLIAHFVKMLHNADSEVRLEAVKALKGLGDHRALEALLEALHDEDSLVRHYAVSEITLALILMPMPPNTEPWTANLAKMLHNADSEVRLEAMELLETLSKVIRELAGYPRFVKLLEDSLNDEDQNVIKKAAFTLHFHCKKWKPSEKMQRDLWAKGITWWPRWYQRLGRWVKASIKSFGTKATSYSGTKPTSNGKTYHHLH